MTAGGQFLRRVVSSDAGPLLLILTLRAAATLVAALSGFSAISDDDFSRVVIAQEFARAPSWDPSRTSWLPLPFWIQGAAMLLLGPTLTVARGAAYLMSGVSAAAVYVAARWLGAEREPACWGGCVAAVLPHAIWLGMATVPDGFTAALCLVGLAGSLAPAPSRRFWGAACLCCATLCRYEAWAVAAYCSAGYLWDAVRQRRAVLGLPAILASSGMLLWMGHGTVSHGAPLFFVTRVSAYRTALDPALPEWTDAFLRQVSLVTFGEPELMAGAVGCLVGMRAWPLTPTAWRLLSGILVLPVFLAVGDLRGGAPTHHAERALLCVWLALAVVVGAHGAQLWRQRSKGLVLVVLLVGAAFLSRSRVALPTNFTPRSTEVQFGLHLSAWLPPGQRILVDTGDYACFAILAALARPSEMEPLLGQDPRASSRDGWSSPAELRQLVASRGANWVVLRRARFDVLPALGAASLLTPEYALIRLE